MQYLWVHSACLVSVRPCIFVQDLCRATRVTAQRDAEADAVSAGTAWGRSVGAP